jgi:DNA primase
MAIPDEDVAQVRAGTDIVALIGEHSALKRQGRRWVGLCPFHAEKTPSFSVNAEEGFYYCFGCQASGDAITFVRAMEHVDFVDAVRFLADRAGVTLHEEDGGGDRRRRTELFDVVERAVEWYHQRLLSAPDAGPARDYLRSRGYDGDVVRRFRLGWAPDGWDALSQALGIGERVLADSGLGFVNRRGRRQDAFRARVIFPICDPSGRPVALGGRILPGRPTGGDNARPEPKYKNSPETAIYVKRRTLYALNWAKHDVVATKEVVVCEGYTDVIGFFQAGVPRAVATCGTALAEEHFTLLRNFGRRIVLAYDADNAGQSAMSRVYEWERRHEVDVAVAVLPPGSDPGELARRDPGALAAAVQAAKPFLQFRVDQVFDQADLASAEGRAHAADDALRAVAEHPDDLVRDQYAMQVADRCRLEPALVRERLEEARRRPPDPPARAGGSQRGGAERAGSGVRRGGSSSPSGSGGSSGDEWEPGNGESASRARGDAASDDGRDGHDPSDRDGRRPASGARRAVPDRPGLEALRWAVHRPELMATRLDESLFADGLHRQAFQALSEAESLHEAIEGSPPDVADLLTRVTVEEPLVTVGAVGDPEDAVVAQLVRAASRRALGLVQAEARTNPSDLAGAASDTAKVKRWLEDLDDPATCRESTDRLLAWLRARRQEDR